MSIIQYEKKGKIAVFTINNPDSLGALTPQAISEFHDALVDFRDDDGLVVGILTGTGEKAFCAGVDIKQFLPWAQERSVKPWQVPGTLMRRLELWKPMIAACNGITYGGGLEMSLGCDIRICSENAKFALPEAGIGAFPGGGGSSRLARTIPRGKAFEMLFTAKPIDAQEAYRVGLVNYVVPLDQLMPKAMSLAETISQNSPVVLKAIKEAVTLGLGMSLEESLRFEEYFNRMVMATNDFEEGTAAFKEKRKPKFEGR
ncbi:MAG: enoyl-CoA hydratase/isomerase family protein [Dehalococcoidales bacterium]|nr:enoyl-CoA hydratase/isomerase family protein [Dehalococcoidales bacterium]